MAPGGWLFVTALSTSDPGESEFARCVRTWFTSDRLTELFDGLRVDSCEEIAVTDRSHGQPHEHYVLRLIAQALEEKS